MTEDRAAGRKAMIYSVIALHVWGSMIVYAATIKGIDSSTLESLMDGIMFGIPATLAVLAGDKSLQNLIAARFGVQRVEETTTTIKTAPTAAESTGAIAISTEQPKQG